MTETGATQAEDAHTAEEPHVFADILCAVDGTHRSYAAVEQAAALAGADGRLSLLAVTAIGGGEGQFRQAAIGPQRAERVLEHAARIAERAGVPCTTAVDPGGPPPQVILERAAGHDLLALGAPSASLLGGILIDGVAHRAVRSPTAPLLAARELPERAGRFAERIVLASDGLDGSDELVALAGRLAREQDAKVTLLHAVGVESRARPHRISEQARTLDLAVGGSGEVRVEAGDAAGAILQAARESSASLIVMGSRGAKGLKALGSVSARVLHEAHCSLLLLAPDHLHAPEPAGA